MMEHAAAAGDHTTLADTLPSVTLLLAGVPTLTAFVMTAVRYVASGSF